MVDIEEGEEEEEKATSKKPVFLFFFCLFFVSFFLFLFACFLGFFTFLLPFLSLGFDGRAVGRKTSFTHPCTRSRRCLWARRRTGRRDAGRPLWPKYRVDSNICNKIQ